MADIRFYFLVTGRTDNNGFGGFAHRLAVETARSLVSGKKPWTARFIHFDCWNNIVEVGDFTASTSADRARGGPKWVSLASFTPGNGEDAKQNPKSFVDTTPHSLQGFTNQFSITNVYHSVRGCPPSSVMEICFIAHAFEDGPVLVNSSVSPSGLPLVARPRPGIDDRADQSVKVKAWDSFPNQVPKRWDQDGDGRMDADFAENMGEDPDKEGTDLALDGVTKLKGGGKNALTEFKAALNTDARIRLLGCDVQDVVYDGSQIRQTIKSTVFQVLLAAMLGATAPRIKGSRGAATNVGKMILSGTIKPDQALTFDLAGVFHDEATDTTGHYTVHDPDQVRILHFQTDTAFFGSPPPTSTVITSTWKEIVKFVGGQAPLTYQFRAADVLGIDLIATPLGASGEIDEEKNPDKMVACGSDPRCTSIVHFYKNFLDLPITDDFYSLFNSTSLAKLRDHATNG